MNVGVNYLREHVIDEARIHYTITNAGGAPNIVPKEAESWYYVRAPHRKDVKEITERLIKMVEAETKKFLSVKGDEKPYIHQGGVDKEKADSVVLAGSSDSGDVSWIMPMNLFLTATWPLGVPAHTWQATSASGSSLGVKGMLYAAKVFTGIAYDLLNDSALVEVAKKEFEERTKNMKYVSPLK